MSMQAVKTIDTFFDQSWPVNRNRVTLKDRLNAESQEQLATTRCGFCAFTYEGSVADGHVMFLLHECGDTRG